MNWVVIIQLKYGGEFIDVCTCAVIEYKDVIDPLLINISHADIHILHLVMIFCENAYVDRVIVRRIIYHMIMHLGSINMIQIHTNYWIIISIDLI